MPCCAVLCCAVPCRTVPCHYFAVLCCAVPYRTVPCRVVPYHAMPYRTVPFRFFRAVPCCAVPCCAVPCRTVPFCARTVPYRAMTCCLLPSSAVEKRHTSSVSSVVYGGGPEHRPSLPHRLTKKVQIAGGLTALLIDGTDNKYWLLMAIKCSCSYALQLVHKHMMIYIVFNVQFVEDLSDN